MNVTQSDPPSTDGLDPLMDWLNREAGLELDRPKFRRRLERVVKERSSANDFSTREEYVEYLVRTRDREELNHLVEETTVNETLMYRYPDQLQHLRDNCFRSLKTGNSENITIVSAGASQGVELYSVLIKLLEHPYFSVRKARQGQYRFIGYDISETAISEARQGQYSRRTVEHAPDEIVDRYFRATGDGYRINDDLRQLVEFKVHNLRQPLPVDRADMILARNVLYYFDDRSRRDVLNHFTGPLRDAGYLVLSPSEDLAEEQVSTPVNRLGQGVFALGDTDTSISSGRSQESDRVHRNQPADISPDQPPDDGISPAADVPIKFTSSVLESDEDLEPLRQYLAEDGSEDQVLYDLREVETVNRDCYRDLRRAERMIRSGGGDVRWALGPDSPLEQTLCRWGLEDERIVRKET